MSGKHPIRAAIIFETQFGRGYRPGDEIPERVSALREAYAARLAWNMRGLDGAESLLDAVWNTLASAFAISLVAVPVSVLAGAPIWMRVTALTSAVASGICWKTGQLLLSRAVSAEEPLEQTLVRWALRRRWAQIRGADLGRAEVRAALQGHTGEALEVEEIMFALALHWDGDAGALRDAALAVLASTSTAPNTGVSPNKRVLRVKPGSRSAVTKE